jgi:hypothetical protein
MARQFREQLEEEAILEETRPARDVAPGHSASTAPASVVTSGTATSASMATPGATPTHSDPADNDTRHQDYGGAAYEPPTPPPAAEPAATPAAAVEPVSDHGGRGA